MKIYERVVIDIETGVIESEDSYEYNGPIAHCGNGGGGPGGGDTGGYAVGSGFGEGDEGFADAAFGTQGVDSGFSTSAGSEAGLGIGTEGAAPMGGQHGVPVSALPNSAVNSSTVAKGVSLAVSAVPLVGAFLGLMNAAGAFNGESTGNTATMGEGIGPGGVNEAVARMQSNPIVQRSGLQGNTNLVAATEAPGEDEGTTKKSRKRTQTLMTGPLGLLSRKPVAVRTLMARGSRETLG